jgi:reactive intermediate/imine deaminase
MSVGIELDPGWAWDDKIPMSQGVKIGNLLFISGQIALDPNGKVVGEGDLKAQSHKVYENIEAILDQAGGTFENIVKVTAYLTDMTRYGQYNEVRGKFFKDLRPASTTVEVKGLAFPGLLVEVEAVAFI